MLRKFVQVSALAGVVLGMGAVGAGCLDRPVTAQAPTIKTNFTSAVSQSGINKVDILFDIDNSASMGDKQSYLIQAIPQMISRLVTPRCIDGMGNPTGTNAGVDGTCPTGSSPEFTAVHDMHIGVVTSSLGSRLGNAGVCDPTIKVTSKAGVTVSAFNDDQGHLINRTGPYGSGAPIAGDALPEGGGFLYWFPTDTNKGSSPVAPPSTPYLTAGSGTSAPAGTLIGDFTELVGGAGESGCGIESQLESWYRFLIQPDPYGILTMGTITGANQTTPPSQGAVWSGIDTTIIQQRHDFLRPDSLVAVIVLSDENDSEIDVRSYGGTGYKFMESSFAPPRATSACTVDPGSAACFDCPSNCATVPTGKGCSDANCTTTSGVWPQSSADWGSNLNLRHVHMAQKYDLNPQYPLTRYYNGLTSNTVPNRFGEYPDATDGYVGTNNCVNPLFAGTLPTQSDVPDPTSLNPAAGGTASGGGALCAIAGGPGTATRKAGDVFFAHIGGVPHQLLQNNAANCTAAKCTGAATDAASCVTDCAQKDALATTDWISILGNSGAAYVPNASGTFPAVAYDYGGIDPHMIESYVPRNNPSAPGTPASMPSVSTLAAATFTGTTWPTDVAPDPINGREWVTNMGIHSLPVDREYACIFQLPTTPVQTQRDCSVLKAATIEGNSCDCDPGPTGWLSGDPAAATGNMPEEVPPLCSKTSTDGTITSSVGDYTVQVAAKAYPTIRELTLANMMQQQGIVSSLCPIHINDNATGDDPLYGYRPAVNAIVNRLKSALGAECVPALTPVKSDGGGSSIPCLVIVSAPKGTTGFPKDNTCTGIPGFSAVTPTGLLTTFQASEIAQQGDAAAAGILAATTCQLNQVSVPAGSTCLNGATQGWCYITGAAVASSTCTQEIAYSSSSLVPNGSTISLQCVAQNNASDGGSEQ